MNGYDLTVGWPLALWGLLSLPLLALLVFRSRFPIGWKRRLSVVVTRVIAVGLLVAAVADLRLGWPTHDLSVATVIDGTQSITPADRARVRQQIAEVAGQHSDVAWVDSTAPEVGRTRPATDVSVAVASLPRDRVRRLLLATDGRDPGGSLGAAVAAAHRAGVEVSVLPVGDEPPIDLVSVRGVQVPRMVRAGDRIDVGVEMHASRDVDTRIQLSMDGHEVAHTEALARRGDSSAHASVTFPEEEGVHELSIALGAGGDVIPENNLWRTLVRVSPKPRVRILHDPRNGPPLLASVLDQGGMRVDVSRITDAPQSAAELDPYALCIIDEAELNDLSETQQHALRDWVEQQGGGLITVTGDHPVRRTPQVLREIEPITVPPAIPEPRPLELVLVIDRSSSMSGIKMQQARNAGVAAVNALRQDARVGVVAFSGGADRVMAPVGMDQRADVISFISSIQASGGTDIGAALAAANAIMSHDPRYIHHVILLSDGVSAPDPAIAAATSLAGRGVTITAISIGPRNDLMAQIAQIGRGRYHVTDSAGSLPSLFVREAQYRQPPANRRQPFVPRMVTPLASIEGIDFASAPPLAGHALSSLRPGATTVLASPERYPVLAHWHRGLGQVATFTSATNGAWADEWRAWPGFRELWVGLAEGMLRTRTIDPPQLRLTPHPLVEGVQVLTVLAPTIGVEPMPIVTLWRSREHGEALELGARGPGVWQADLIEDEGFLIDARMPTDEQPTVAVGFDRPYDPEIMAFGSNPLALTRLAAAGGGQVLARVDRVLGNVPETIVQKTLRTPLLALALFFYLLGLLLLRLPDHSISATVVRPESKKQRRWQTRGGGSKKGMDRAA